MIVNAFNEGDRKTLKNLLSREVYDSFVQAIGDREGRGEVVQSSFVSLDKADITAAAMKGRTAHVTVRFVSQMISAVKDKAGAVIEGSLDKISEVTDLWTFARDTSSSDPELAAGRDRGGLTAEHGRRTAGGAVPKVTGGRARHAAAMSRAGLAAISSSWPA